MPDRILTSWKEIAAYLGVGVRTAQLWERDRGMPVRRLPGPRGLVTASADELDAWRRNDPPAVEPGLVATEVGPEPEAVLASTESAPLVTTDRRWRRWLWWAIPVVACAAAAPLLSSVLFPRLPAAVRVEGHSLVAVDAHDREVWRHDFPFELDHEAHSRFAERTLTWVGDLDGNRVVLFVPYPKTIFQGEAIYCFDARGQQRWRHEPGRRVSTDQKSYYPPFLVRNLLVTENQIVISSIHYTFHPSVITALTADGKVLREYWHPGHLIEIAATTLSNGKHLVLAGGVNNDAKRATIVSLDLARFEGATRAEDPKFQFRNLPEPVEEARLLFGRSCINQKLDPYNVVNQITAMPDELMVSVVERLPSLPGFATVMYTFAPNLSLRGISASDTYRGLHHELFQNKNLDHDELDKELKELAQGIVKKP